MLKTGMYPRLQILQDRTARLKEGTRLGVHLLLLHVELEFLTMRGHR